MLEVEVVGGTRWATGENSGGYVRSVGVCIAGEELWTAHLASVAVAGCLALAAEKWSPAGGAASCSPAGKTPDVACTRWCVYVCVYVCVCVCVSGRSSLAGEEAYESSSAGKASRRGRVVDGASGVCGSGGMLGVGGGEVVAGGRGGKLFAGGKDARCRMYPVVRSSFAGEEAYESSLAGKASRRGRAMDGASGVCGSGGMIGVGGGEVVAGGRGGKLFAGGKDARCGMYPVVCVSGLLSLPICCGTGESVVSASSG
ncbi:collagen alpha-1(XXI) chain [Striga asiatica]|uniref:Collagen alpha-1(XXI) chain n=1 Tax=Striga asiatica TaxID=4170 RepID=A0A5A7RFF7_STRAF|nr:collagen alpha-1(XXI) chain [Striga asiatica]